MTGTTHPHIHAGRPGHPCPRALDPGVSRRRVGIDGLHKAGHDDGEILARDIRPELILMLMGRPGYLWKGALRKING